MSFIKDYSNCIFFDSITGRVRKANEDNCNWSELSPTGITPNGDLFIVCDGMGGHVGGQKASEIAVLAITEYLMREKYPDPQRALRDALQYANMQVIGYAAEHLEYKGMGSTACVLLLQDDYAWIAHAGDSRIYLFLAKEKQLHRITNDHSYVHRILVEQEGLSEEDAESHPRKNIILKALGVHENLDPEIAPEPVLPKQGDIFLICSDGLTGMVDDRTIEQILANDNLILQDKGKELMNKANGEEGEGKGKDNITVQLIYIEQSPHPKSIFKSYNPKSRQFDSKEINNKEINTGFTKKTKGKKRKWIWAAAIVALVLACGFWFVLPKPNKIEKFTQSLDTFKNNVTKIVNEYNDKTDLGNILDPNEKTKLQNQIETEENRVKNCLDTTKVADIPREMIDSLNLYTGKLYSIKDSIK